MRKTTIAALTTLTLGVTQAAYTVKIPLETDQGGTLPRGSIQLKSTTADIPQQPPTENWQPYDPEYGEWNNYGGLYGCSTWLPADTPATYLKTFTQSRNCKQNQTRSIQLREQETTTLSIRDIGSPTTEANTLNVQVNREIIGDTCYYHQMYGGYAWAERFKGQNVPYYTQIVFLTLNTNVAGHEIQEYISGSYRYIRGKYKGTDQYSTYGDKLYEICRIEISP